MAFITKLRSALRVAYKGLLPLGIALGITVFVIAVYPHYPVHEWIFWVYAKLWLWCALFVLACLSIGDLLVGLLLPRGFPLRERLLFAFSTGVLAFFHCMFLGGILGLYGRIFAVAMPVCVAAVGMPRLFKRARRVIRHLRAAS